MEITFLGTGAGVPSKQRNVSSLALSLLQEINSVWLFDCGEGTQHQLLHTHVKPSKINKVFITHLHGDHLFGLPGFLSSRSFLGGDDLLTVYGPPGIKTYIETSLGLSDTHTSYPMNVIELSDEIVFENDYFIVYCKELDHRIQSFGFRIVEKDKRGSLLVERLKKAGIPPGPIYTEIKNKEEVTLPNGQKLNTSPFHGPTKKGRIITILGDTRYSNNHESFVQQSDLLIHEATFSKTKADLARKYFHSTTTEAAQLAKDSHVKKLVLNHVSSRYQQKDFSVLLEEARTLFPNTILAHDFLTVEI
ncbi:ribonuclease Z [Virgibacillus sp. W0181]|uniref:ribonuclease Z n=1 Tax=Virgibacillus sp. W0181 TaxID=3391581 RepID=UPI003F45D83D